MRSESLPVGTSVSCSYSNLERILALASPQLPSAFGGRYGKSLSPPHNMQATSPSDVPALVLHCWTIQHTSWLICRYPVPTCIFSCACPSQGPKNILAGATVLFSNSLPSGLSVCCGRRVSWLSFTRHSKLSLGWSVLVSDSACPHEIHSIGGGD